MSSSRQRAIWLVATVGVALAALLWFVPSGEVTDTDLAPLASNATQDAAVRDAQAGAEGRSANPARLAGEPVADPSVPAESGPASAAATRGDPGLAPLAVEVVSLDVAAIGVTPLSDEIYLALLDRLRNDPARRAELFAQMSTETDTKRLGRLAQLLGDTGDSQLSEHALRLLSSGVPAQRTAGFELLRQAQPYDPAAREAALMLLGSAADEQTLISALDVLARPGGDAQSRAAVVSQVITLTQHDDAKVRDYSLSMLGRWSDSPDVVPALALALQDDTAHVRESAAYALAENPDQSPEVTADLFAVADDAAEVRLTRLGAIHALKQRRLSPEQTERLRGIIVAMNSRQP